MAKERVVQHGKKVGGVSVEDGPQHAKKTGEIFDSEARFDIKIHKKNEGDKGTTFNINGYRFTVLFDKVIRVPESLVKYLLNLKETKYRQEESPSGEGTVMIGEEIQKYTFTQVGGPFPSREEERKQAEAAKKDAEKNNGGAPDGNGEGGGSGASEANDAQGN